MKKTMTISFADLGAIDARYVYRDMQNPVVVELRAEDEHSHLHPLVALRVARMDAVRGDMMHMAQVVVEGNEDVNTPEYTNVMLLRIQRAKKMMLRVLEVSDAPDVKEKVRDTAKAISNSLGFTASALAMGEHMGADIIKRHSDDVKRFVAAVDDEARIMQQSYEGMTVELIDTPERVVMHFPVRESQSGHEETVRQG